MGFGSESAKGRLAYDGWKEYLAKNSEIAAGLAFCSLSQSGLNQQLLTSTAFRIEEASLIQNTKFSLSCSCTNLYNVFPPSATSDVFPAKCSSERRRFRHCEPNLRDYSIICHSVTVKKYLQLGRPAPSAQPPKSPSSASPLFITWSFFTPLKRTTAHSRRGKGSPSPGFA